MLKRNEQKISINKRDVAIALHWIDFEYSNTIIRNTKAQSKIKKENKNYGFVRFNEEEKKGIITLSDKELNGSFIGAYLVSQKIRNAIFYAKIGINEESEEDLYWLVGIDSMGELIADTDVIVNDEELYELVNEIQTIYNDLELYSPKVDNHLITDNSEIKILELENLLTKETDKKFVIHNLKQKTNYKLTISVMGVIILTSYVGYEYIYKEKPIIQEITSGQLTNQVDTYYNQVQRMEPRERDATTFNQEERNQYAIEQLNTIMEETFFDKEQIVENIDYMQDILPSYLVEWELTPIVYQNNRFRFAYQRISNSSGYFNQLNTKVREIMQKHGLEYQLLGTSEQLTEAVYRIDFESEKENELLEQRAIEATMKSRQVDPAEELFDEVDTLRQEIDELENEANDLNWFDKRWGVEAERIKQTINIKINEINDLLSRIESVYTEQDNGLDENLLIKSEEEQFYDNYLTSYLNKTQLNSQRFLFTQPVLKGTLPQIEETSNNRRRNRDEQFNPFINIYEFGIRSQGSTTGLESALNIMNIVDNKSIKFFNVEYNTNSNDWVIKGNMYEKF